MIRKKAIEMLEAKLECLENQTSGDYKRCNNDCENCHLTYDQGNLGEQKEALRLAIKSLQEDLYNKATILEKIEQAKRKNEQAFNRYNKYYVLSLENYYNDVDNILCDLIKEFNK
jgi:hypothetical protein